MYTRRAGVSGALVVVALGSLGCTSEQPEKGVTVEMAKEAASAEKAEGRPKPVASGFANPAQGCALLLSSDEFRVHPNPDILAECQEDYGVTLDNASERFQQGVDEAIQKAGSDIGKGD